ncbi:MAG: pepsin/retropepsin-like aspartic protease family protein [Candidatus Acidiferrales bacterium]
MRIAGQRIGILPIGYVAEEVGHPTEAIFGSNVFENFRVTVDYQHERATFASPSSALDDVGEPIPIKILGGTPFVTAMLVDRNGSRISGLFLLDSGSTNSLTLNELFLSAHPEITNGRKFVDTASPNAVGGRIDMRLVRIAGLDFGPFHFNQPVAAIPENSTGVLAHPEIAGFIGAGILASCAVLRLPGTIRMGVYFLSPIRT